MPDPTRRDASAVTASRARLFTLAWIAAIFTLCLIRLCGFVQANAVNLPFEDQWDFLNPLFKDQGPWACFFYQHGPHRLGLGGLAEWYLYHATGWDIRADAWAAVVALAVATLAALALAVRLRGRLKWSDAGFPLLLLSPIHWETMILTPSLAHSILPLMLTFLLVCAWTSTGLITRVLGVGLCGTLILFTGYGVCGVPANLGLALLLWWRAGKENTAAARRASGLILLLLGGAILVFAHGYHWDHGTAGMRVHTPNWWDYPRFWALMFTSLAGLRAISAGTTAVGAVLLALVVGAFLQAAAKIWLGEATARNKAVWVLTGTSLVYMVLTAVGRLPINIEAAFMWRYMTLMCPALCGLALAAEEWTFPRFKPAGGCLMAGWILLAGAICCNLRPEQYAATVALGKRRWIACYLKTHDLGAANQASGFWVYFPAPTAPFIAERLRWLEQRHLTFFRTEDVDTPPPPPAR